jgi:hypothetical protein
MVSDGSFFIDYIFSYEEGTIDRKILGKSFFGMI